MEHITDATGSSNKITTLLFDVNTMSDGKILVYTSKRYTKGGLSHLSNATKYFEVYHIPISDEQRIT